VIDIEHHLVLNVITYPAMGVAFIVSFFWPGVRTFSVFWPQLGVESALLGGVVGAAILAVPFIIYRGGMGMGDIKLGALLGLMTGFPLIIMAILFSWVGGGLVAIVLLALKIKGRKEAIAFAPFMVTAALVTLLWGDAIYQWYM
ncbi:MAG: A24 family peptidase, partial [Dehalococcoidales bacterium]